MKLKICHDPEKKTLTIPRAALQLAQLERDQKLDLLAESGFILTSREDLTTAERIGMVKTLSDLTVALIVGLAAASLEAAKDGRTEDCSLSIPPCLLEQAGIDPEEALEAYAENGRVVVAAAEAQDGDCALLESQNAGFLSMLEGCGVDMDGLRVLLGREGCANE